MKKLLLTVSAVFLISIFLNAQPNRIVINDQQIFLSGMNLAWNDFGNDLANFDEPIFQKALDDISKAGGNSMRWWIHVNGTKSPQFTDGKVSGIKADEINNIKKVLDLAHQRNIVISLCLWSFDMLQGEHDIDFKQNKNLLKDPIYTKAYINNALIPMVKALKGHPAILCWEIFNEPEGMTTEFGWTPEKISMKYIQQFVNLTAGAIHREAPNERVSNGSWSFKSASDIGEYKNYYKDEELIAVGGDSLGTLDFYMVHYYDWGKEDLSPFHHPASYWNLDKSLVIAEFSAKGPCKHFETIAAYKYLYENGYAGGLSWTWTNHDGHGGIKDATPGLLDLLKNHPNDIKIKYNSDK